MYPDVSQMYLKCPVTFQENTCILIFCMYFTRIPNESKIHFGIHIRYIKIKIHVYLGRFLGVTLDTYQDTSGDVYLGLFITIHHDTSRYICGIHMGYILKYIPLECIQRGTYLRCRIHAGYMRDTCICKGDQDTFGIHSKYMMRYMYLKCI